MKEAGMRIRIEPELREAFVSACRSQDLPAAQVLRSFMREYVRKSARKQGSDQIAPEAANGQAQGAFKAKKPVTKASPYQSI